MTNASVPVFGTPNNLQTYRNTVDGAVVDSEAVTLTDTAGNPISPSNPVPVAVQNFPATQAVSVADGVDTAQGAKGDTPATSSTGSWSVISLLKGIWSFLSGVLQTNLNLGGTPVSGANPIPVTGTVSATGATLNILSGLNATNYDLSAGAYNQNTAVGGPYKLNSIKFHFSTAAAKTVTVTDVTLGTVLYYKANNTDTDLVTPGWGFPSGRQVNISVSSTSGPCLMTFSADVENGQLPLGTDPVIADFGSALRYSIVNSRMNSRGAVMTSEPIAQVECQWDAPLANNDATASNSGSGILPTQGNGLVTLSIGSGATGLSDVVTNKKIRYAASAPMWAEMTAAVSAVPTSNLTQVWFIYWGDDTNYIRLGLVDSNLVLQAGRGGTQFVNQTISTVDLTTGLTSLIPNKFYRNSTGMPGGTLTAEAINVKFLNIYYLEWRYLGIGPIFIRIVPPDGGAATLLYVQQRPNTEALPTTFSPSQPLRQRIVKSASDAQALSLVSGSWAGGTMEPQSSFERFEFKSRKQIQKSYANQVASLSPAYTVSPGRQLLMTSCQISVSAGGGAGQLVQLFDGSTLVYTFQSSTNNTYSSTSDTFPTPLIFTTNVTITIAGVMTYSVSFAGYEKEA